jgi:pimeloyl-ACP methyl ester carboxylesterase
MDNKQDPTSALDSRRPTGLLPTLQRSVYEAGLAMERFRSRFTPRTVECGGRTLSYLERPGPGPTVVLVHGFTGSKDSWLQYAKHLPRDLRLLAPDLIGHGDNDPDLDCAYDGWAITATLHDVLTELGCEEFHLVGHSLGGLLAAGYAMKHPSQVQSLFLISPAGVDPPGLSECYRLIEAGDNPFLCDTRADYNRIMGLVFQGPMPIPAIAHTLLSRALIERRPIFAKVWEDLHSVDENILSMLAEIKAPTRVVWGKHDRVLHPDCLEIFVQNIPNADSAWLDCGHCPPIECPAELATLHLEMMRPATT